VNPIVAVTLVLITGLTAGYIWHCWRARRLSRMGLGWKLLWLAGVQFVPGGVLWLLQWHPRPGPYAVGETYPFGDYVDAWEVSMGFAFVAFGLLFAEAAVLAAGKRSAASWLTLLATWALLMFPHGLITLMFALDDPSLASLGVSAYGLPFGFVWFAQVATGFILSGRETFWSRPAEAEQAGAGDETRCIGS